VSDAPFVARVSRSKVLRHLLMLLLTAGMMAVLTFVVATSERMAGPADWAALLFCVGVTGLFLYAAYWVGRSLFHRGEALVLDAEGMRMPGCFEGVLPWSAIARVQEARGRLELWLGEDAAIPPGKAFERVLRNSRAIRRAGGSDLALSMWLADRRTSEMVEAIRARAPQLFA